MKKVLTPFVLGLIKKENKYLLTRRQEKDREDPSEFVCKWQLPGGGIKFEESVEEALKREIKEEVGFDIEIIKLLPQLIDSKRETWHGIGLIYLCKLFDENAKVILNQEASEFGWFTIDEIMGLEMLPGSKEAIQETDNLF